MEVIVKKYEHFNRAFNKWDSPKGKYISTKQDYDREMKEGGFVSYEEMKQRTESNRERNDRPYVPSSKVLEITKEIIKSKGKDGNLKLGSRVVDEMVKMGAVSKKIPDYMKLPSAYRERK